MPEAGRAADNTASGTAGKAAVLEGILRDIAPGGTVAVAYSGGLDSRFLVHMAQRAGLRVAALHVRGPHIPGHEHAYAVQWAKTAGAPLTVIELDPLALPDLADNPKDRCYHCKKTVFTALRKAAGNLPLCDGTNASDKGEYRPGLRALAELGILSPLAGAGLEKSDIRELAAMTGLENPSQAAQPCLLTRFGYGEAITASLLMGVDAAEAAVRRAFAKNGLPNAPFRFRYENAQTPALHVSLPALSESLMAELAAALATAGFSGAPVRVVASLSGYFDRV